MTPRVRLHRVAGTILWLAMALVLCVHWVGRAQQQAGVPADDDPRFTGRSVAMESGELTVSRRQFDAGARSAWHSHPSGQLLFVEKGRARIQRRGEAMRELRTGQSDYTPPNVLHWHGAVPGEPLVQVAVGFGGETQWRERVTDEEYDGRTSGPQP